MAVGNDLRYHTTTCFDPFPFPEGSGDWMVRIRNVAEQLDAHRKRQQAAHPGLTLTGMYNVLEKLRRAEPLNAKDKLIHAQGLVSVLKSLHDDLDAAVLEAYGWSDLQPALADHTHAEARAAAVETLLERLVALNAKRAAEEAAGLVRWLRPEYQVAGGGLQVVREATAEYVMRLAWPKRLAEQAQAVRAALDALAGPATAEQVAAGFVDAPAERVAELLETLASLGQVEVAEDGRFTAG